MSKADGVFQISLFFVVVFSDSFLHTVRQSNRRTDMRISIFFVFVFFRAPRVALLFETFVFPGLDPQRCVVVVVVATCQCEDSCFRFLMSFGFRLDCPRLRIHAVDI